MDNDNRQFADQLLEASLEQFSTAVPRAGLAGRILAGVAASNRATHQRNWIWGLAFSTVAVAACLIVVLALRQTVVPVAPPAPVAIAQPKVVFPPARELPQVAKARTPSVVAQRPQQFPTPAPLGEQEKLLLLYVREAPKSELASPLPTTERDLEIPDIRTAALEIKDLPGTEDEK